jgi:hypothetical protein
VRGGAVREEGMCERRGGGRGVAQSTNVRDPGLGP